VSGAPWTEAWEELLGTLSRNPLRTLLTAAGVAWGMLMLVGMAGAGEGLQVAMRRSLGDDAANTVYVWARRTALPYAGYRAGRDLTLRNGDAEAIAAQVAGVSRVAPRIQLGGYRAAVAVRTEGGEEQSLSVSGDSPDFFVVQPIELLEGRVLSARDMDARRRVVLLGVQAAEQLFGPGAAGRSVGRMVAIQDVWFTVVGVFASPIPGEDGDRAESAVHVPLSTFQQAFHTADRLNWIAVGLEDDADSAAVEARVRALLARRHGVHPEDAPAFGSNNAAEAFQRMQNTFKGVRAFVLFVGGMTLLAGAFGVTNVMLVSVRERTAELGLRRAIGATPADLRQMILREAMLLTVLAGEVGLLGGLGLLELASLAAGADHPVLGQPRVDAGLVLLASALMAAAGAVAGLLPAVRAAAVHPVEALRGD
jgi:putative ABC transport system permease protein